MLTFVLVLNIFLINQINIKNFCMCASNQICEYFVIKIPLSLLRTNESNFISLYIFYVCETEKVAGLQSPLVSQPKKVAWIVHLLFHSQSGI